MSLGKNGDRYMTASADVIRIGNIVYCHAVFNVTTSAKMGLCVDCVANHKATPQSLDSAFGITRMSGVSLHVVACLFFVFRRYCHHVESQSNSRNRSRANL